MGWESAIRHGGLLALAMCAVALAALVVALVAVVRAFDNRKGIWAAVVASWLATAAAIVGVLTGIRARAQVDEALGLVTLSAEELAMLAGAGYDEARTLTFLGALLAVVPLIVALAAVSRHLAPPRRKAPLGAIAGAWITAIVVVIPGMIASGEEAGQAHLHAWTIDRTAEALGRSDCDPCSQLGIAFELVGVDVVRAQLPGAEDRAKRCVDEALRAIEEGRRQETKACAAGSDFPRPPALEPLGVGIDVAGELERLERSPLLIDPTQRSRVEVLLAKARTTGVRTANVPPSEPVAEEVSSTVTLGAITTTPTVTNAEAVVHRMQAGFRACHRTALQDDPELAGSVTIVAELGPNGEVVSVTVPPGPLAPIADCLRRVVASGIFAPPDGGTAEISFPLQFTLVR